MYRKTWLVAMITSLILGLTSACWADCLGGDLDLDDVVAWKNNYGQSPSVCETGDYNGDCITDIRDFVILKRALFGTLSPPPPGPDESLELVIDATGEMFLSNPTSSAIPIDGYQLRSADGLLDMGSWYGVAHRIPGEFLELITLLGMHATSFVYVLHGTDALCEVSLSSPIDLAPGMMFSLGSPVAGIPLTDLEFLYTNADAYGSGVFRGNILPDPAKPGDADGDGDVDLDDFAALKAGFGVGTTWPEGDFDGDRGVDLDDFTILKSGFGTSHTP